MTIPHYRAARYVVPLREGGSLPAIVETDDGSLFATKFRGAGQGARVLVAEIVAGLLARYLGFPVPDLGLIHLDDGFGRAERDPEIQDLLRGSEGLNVGLRYLEGALNFNPVADAGLVAPDFAADVVWFDAFITNVDRTARNPNLMVWNGGVQLIDHGSALYIHFDWASYDEARARSPFAPIRQHVLLPLASSIADADRRLRPRLDASVLRRVLDHVPDALLMDAPGGAPPFATADENRAAYVDYLSRRLEAADAFVAEAETAAEAARRAPARSLPYRR